MECVAYKLREFARLYCSALYYKDHCASGSATLVTNEEQMLSDLTALISENYIAKEEVDKMVSERLREELGKFIKWYNSGYEQARKPHLIVKEYLKSREK